MTEDTRTPEERLADLERTVLEMGETLDSMEAEYVAPPAWQRYGLLAILGLTLMLSIFASFRSYFNAVDTARVREGNTCTMAVLLIDPAFRVEVAPDSFSPECPGVRDALETRDAIVARDEDRRSAP